MTLDKKVFHFLLLALLAVSTGLALRTAPQLLPLPPGGEIPTNDVVRSEAQRPLENLVGPSVRMVSHASANVNVGSPFDSEPIVEFPVSFKVFNTNTSGVPCPSDDNEYTARGHLIGPVEALTDPKIEARTVTLYIYGFDEGEWVYRFTRVPSYNMALGMAERGHISVTIDMVGYGKSGKPHGYLACFGSQADMTHQIIGQLRNGTYSIDGSSPFQFGKVILFGDDVAGAMAEIEAYSYKDIDGLVTLLWADQGFTPYIVQLYALNSTKCIGGEKPEGGGVAGGYLLFGPPNDQFRHDLIYDAEEEVIEGILESRNRNPCGHAYSPPIRLTTSINQQRLSEIDIPVLLMFPTKDPVIGFDGQSQQAGLYSGTDDVTSVWFESGHFPMLERVAPEFQKTLSKWLKERW